MSFPQKVDELKSFVSSLNSQKSAEYLKTIEEYIDALHEALVEKEIPADQHSYINDGIMYCFDAIEAALVRSGHPHLAAAVEILKKLERAREIVQSKNKA